MDIHGRVVVVTGGGGGIGAALCRRFAAEGARALIVADLDHTAAATVAAAVGGTAVRTDVTVETEVRDLVDRVVEEHGRVDTYCSNAGVAIRGGPEVPDAGWQQSWMVNTLAHVYAARAVLPHMLARGEGYFVGTVSAAGLLNHVTAAPYAVTKAAALSLFEWLAIAHHDQGIRVSVICPQGVRTPMLDQEGERSFLAADAIEPEVVADAVVHGLKDEAFLILPHTEVADYFRRKASDYERWLRGMRRLRGRALG
jgi:NAD(P)-dependent dehydrogenase (short-subunit alcohol dehydrogenase family)